MAAKKIGRDTTTGKYAETKSGSVVERTHKTGGEHASGFMTQSARGYAWSPKDIKPAAPRRDSRPAADRRQELSPRPGFLVIEAEDVEPILPHELTDAEIRSMDDAADANRGKPTAGSIRKL